MKPPAAALPILALLLAGCGVFGDAPEDQARLALACEVAHCHCIAPRGGIFDSSTTEQAVAWRADGSAYCPTGFLLSRLAPGAAPPPANRLLPASGAAAGRH
jgi:hypothetical protein